MPLAKLISVVGKFEEILVEGTSKTSEERDRSNQDQ